MPSEIDSPQPSNQPLARYEPPIKPKTAGTMPLKGEAEKVQSTVQELRGVKTEKKTPAYSVARAALGAYTKTTERQADPNFFLKLVNSVVDYIKEKISSYLEATAPANEIPPPSDVTKISLENDLRTQLKNLDHNLSNPDDPIPLDPSLPKTRTELKELIDELVILSNPVSAPFDVKTSSLEKDLRAQLANVELNMYHPETPVELDPNLPKTRTELKEALNEFVSLPFGVTVNKSNHLKMAKEQLELLKQQLRDHPGEAPKGLNPIYPQAIIPLQKYITDLEKNLKELKENKIQALSDFGEDEAYFFDEVNRSGNKSYAELQQEFDAEPIAHPRIEQLNETIKLLEMELDSLKVQHERRMNTLKQQPSFNLERSQQHLIARYEKEAEALINQIQSKNAELIEIEASRTPFTRGDLRKAEGQLKFSEGLEKIIAGRKKMALEAFEAEVKRLKNAIKNDSYAMRSEKAIQDLSNQIESLEAKLDQLYFSEDSELESILELESQVNKLKDQRIKLENSQIFRRRAEFELADLKNVREGEVASFKETIRIQEETLERIGNNLEDLEILDQKKTLEAQLAMNYATLNEIMEELDILNAYDATKTKTPTTRGLKDLDEGNDLDRLI